MEIVDCRLTIEELKLLKKENMKPNELEKNQRKRGRPQSEKTLNL